MAAIGVASYGIGALAFALLALLLATSWRGGTQGALLGCSCAAMAVWSAILAWGAYQPELPVVAVETAEVMRSGCWLGFLAWLLCPLRHANRGVWLLQGLAFGGPAVVLLGIIGLRVVSGTASQPLVSGVHPIAIGAGLGFALLGLVLLEQVYRNLPHDRRWAVKFLCLGIALIFAYDLYLYSDSLLFRRLDITLWQARGMVQSLAVPLIAIAATRNPSWDMPVFVSRQVAFHTAAVLVAGGYLVLIALGGYYIRDFGGSWGAFAQIVLTAAAALALVVVFGSADVRARVRVWLTKHFFSNKYDYREEWLRLTHRLAEEDDGLTPYQRAIHVVARIVGSPAGAVWRHEATEGGFVPVGAWYMEVPVDGVIRDDDPLIAFLQRSRWIVDIAEYRANPEWYAEMELPEPIAAMNAPWAIVPLLQQETVTGFIVLQRPEINADINWEDRDLLKTLGRQIAVYLGQHEDAQALSQARQFEAFNQLTAFLMHDLKNLIAQQSLVVKNAEKHKHNPEFVDDAMATIGNSVERMERLLEHLQRHREGGVVERVDVARTLREAVTRCDDRYPSPQVAIELNGECVEADPEALSMVLIHLIRNAQDATRDDGEVRISAEAPGGEIRLEIVDSGDGMTPEFVRNELFRPFKTTKSSKGMGIGAHQAREFVHRAGGRLSVFSSPGEGTRCRIALPAAYGAAGDGDWPEPVAHAGGNC